jgi:hypothetical protein
MRTRNFSSPVNLNPFDGVKLRVRGDGMRQGLPLVHSLAERERGGERRFRVYQEAPGFRPDPRACWFKLIHSCH